MTSFNEFRSSYVRSMAFAMRYPQFAMPGHPTPASDSLYKVNRLARACSVYVQDYDEVFPPLQSNLREIMSPYLHSRSAADFASPLDTPTTVSYKFNPKLAGRKLADVARQSETVMLYEGVWGKPAFRYNGQAVIGFVDGKARFVTRAQEKRLIWTLTPRPSVPVKRDKRRRPAG